MITAEEDPLRSEGQAYAARLREAGVPTTLRHFDGTMHEFFSMPAVIDQAKEAIALAAKELTEAFAAPILPEAMTTSRKVM